MKWTRIISKDFGFFFFLFQLTFAPKHSRTHVIGIQFWGKLAHICTFVCMGFSMYFPFSCQTFDRKVNICAHFFIGCFESQEWLETFKYLKKGKIEKKPGKTGSRNVDLVWLFEVGKKNYISGNFSCSCFEIPIGEEFFKMLQVVNSDWRKILSLFKYNFFWYTLRRLFIID